MVLYEVFSHSILKRYRTNLFSKASLVQIISITLSLLSPFLIAYFTGGFWIREKTYSEYPKISFQYRYIALLEAVPAPNQPSTIYLASSYQSINEIYGDAYRPATVEVYELDSNDDNYKDSLKLNIFISNIDPTQVQIRSVKLLLLFNSSLSTKASINFESIGYLQASNGFQASELNFNGQLAFFQREKIKENVIYNEYNYIALNQTNIDLASIDLDSILSDFTSRKYGTKLETDFVTWKQTQSAGFSINGFIRYPMFQISFIPWFWEQFKYGWIQYIAILIPSLYIFKYIKIFIYENQLVPTIVSVSPGSNEKVKVS